MTTFTIIGTGNMGKAIGGILADGGSDVSYVAHDQVGSAPLGDVVVLAVPYPALASIVDAYGDQLAGKVVVDITNPLNVATFDSLVVAADGSAAAELQAKLPAARVIKAFNTNFAATLASRNDRPDRRGRRREQEDARGRAHGRRGSSDRCRLAGPGT